MAIKSFNIENMGFAQCTCSFKFQIPNFGLLILYFVYTNYYKVTNFRGGIDLAHYNKGPLPKQTHTKCLLLMIQMNTQNLQPTYLHLKMKNNGTTLKAWINYEV